MLPASGQMQYIIMCDYPMAPPPPRSPQIETKTIEPNSVTSQQICHSRQKGGC